MAAGKGAEDEAGKQLTGAKRRPRLAAAVELAVVLAAVGVGLWVPGIDGSSPAAVAILLVVGAVMWRSHRRRTASLEGQRGTVGGCRRAGRSGGALGAWAEMAGITLLVMVAVGGWLAVVREPYETVRPLGPSQPGMPLVLWLARRLALAAGQQVALQWFLGPVLLELAGRPWAAVTLGAGVFGLCHLPNPFLLVVTSVISCVWLVHYLRHRRLAPLVLSHLVLGTFAYVAVPERFLGNLHVGVSAVETWPRFRSLGETHSRQILRVVGTQAYWQAAGGTPEGFVRALYRDILGRVPAAWEVAFWVDRMAWEPAIEVAKKFVVSDELASLREELGEGYSFPLRR